MCSDVNYIKKTLCAFNWKSLDPVGGSKNLDINISAPVDPEVVIELRLREDDDVSEPVKLQVCH